MSDYGYWLIFDYIQLSRINKCSSKNLDYIKLTLRKEVNFH
jgi:hypothetical protein